jgi:hypothetical protein
MNDLSPPRHRKVSRYAGGTKQQEGSMTKIMGRISIEAYHYEPESHALMSLNFTVQFPEGEALVSILDMRPLSLAEEEDGIRALLLHLAEGITSAVQSPQGITSAPQSRG